MENKLWYYSLGGECFNSDEYASKEVCIKDATKDAKFYGRESFYIGTREEVNVKPCAEYILEQADEDLYGEVGDVANGVLTRYDSEKKRWEWREEDYLQSLLDDVWTKYLDKIGGISCFKVVDVQQVVVEED